MPKIRAVCFDNDQTLADYVGMKRVTLNRAADAMIAAGLPLSKEETLKRMYGIYVKYDTLDYSRMMDDLMREPDVQEALKARCLNEDRILARGVTAYRQSRESTFSPYPHTNETLLELGKRGYRLGVISDAPPKACWLRLCEAGVDHYFQHVVAMRGTGKLGLKPFNRMLKELDEAGIYAQETMMVGDSLRRDVRAAKEVGMVTAWAKYGVVSPKDLTAAEKVYFERGAKDRVGLKIEPDFVLDDIADLLKILSKV